MCPNELIVRDNPRENKCFQKYLMILTIYINFYVFRAQPKDSQLALIILPLVKWHHFRVQKLIQPIFHETLKHGICKAVMEVGFFGSPGTTAMISKSVHELALNLSVSAEAVSLVGTTSSHTHTETLTKSFWTRTCTIILPELHPES